LAFPCLLAVTVIQNDYSKTSRTLVPRMAMRNMVGTAVSFPE
jgi:hypothetical protein